MHSRLSSYLRNAATRKRVESGFTLVEQLLVVSVVLIVAAMAIPRLSRTMQNIRTSGDARDLSDIVMEAKMAAAANFSHARAYFDLNGRTFRVEVWDKTGSSSFCAGTPCWNPQFSSSSAAKNFVLSTGVSAGYGSLATPPPSSQGTIGEASLCTDSTHDTGTSTVSNTACVEFNSRAVPICTISTCTGGIGSPTASDVFYINDGYSAYAVTASATGNVLLWRADISATSCSSGSCWKKR